MSWQYGWNPLLSTYLLLFLLFYILYGLRLRRLTNTIPSPRWTTGYKFLLRSLAFALLLIALLGPSWGTSSRKVVSEGKDVFFCVDLSQSMNAQDIHPTRLEKVKFELKRMVDALTGNRMGIVMFSNDAFMQCPLTYDLAALNLFISSLNTYLVPNTGTDFVPPLRMSMEKMKKEPTVEGKKVAKVVVLISDGENFGSETENIVEKMKEANITLFTLGIGTPTGAEVPGEKGGKKYDKKGQVVVSKLNSQMLRKLASKTGGKYFEINPQQNQVGSLLQEIGKIQNTVRDAKVKDTSANKYEYYLLFALLLLLIDYLVPLNTFRT